VQTQEARHSSLVPLAAALFGLIVVFHLGNALVGKSLFRAIHLGTALEYAHGPINVLQPTIVGFNATGTPTAQEMPVWQAAVGLVFKAAGSTWYGWANLVSLLFFAAGLWPLFQLARHYCGERAAWWGMVFLLAQPLIVVWSGMASTDGLCLAVTIWFLFFADKMVRTEGVRWWWPTVLFACLAAVCKLPFFVTAGLCSVLLLLMNNARSGRNWILLAGAGVLSAGVFVVWTHYTDSLAARAEYPYLELRLARSPFTTYWYFGDLHYRLSLGPWIKGGWRFLHATLGSLPLVVLLVAGLLRPGNRQPKLWLLAAFLTTLVFAHVVLIHWHYYLMYCPAVALLCGATLARWETLWAQEITRPWLRLALAGLVLVFSALDGVISTKITVYYDPFRQEMSELIRQHTKPEDKLILYGGDWGGEELFRAGRKGFYVYSLETLAGGGDVKGLYDLLASEADLRRLKSLGYNKLVLMSESPAQFAAVAVNPGSKRKRYYYPRSISKTVDTWPDVYRSEDLLIKEIP